MRSVPSKNSILLPKSPRSSLISFVSVWISFFPCSYVFNYLSFIYSLYILFFISYPLFSSSHVLLLLTTIYFSFFLFALLFSNIHHLYFLFSIVRSWSYIPFIFFLPFALSSNSSILLPSILSSLWSLFILLLSLISIIHNTFSTSSFRIFLPWIILLYDFPPWSFWHYIRLSYLTSLISLHINNFSFIFQILFCLSRATLFSLLASPVCIAAFIPSF